VSREELGTAPVEVPRAPDTPTARGEPPEKAPETPAEEPAESRRAEPLPQQHAPPRRRTTAALLVAGLVVGVGIGWLGNAWWAGTADDRPGRQGSALTATVTEVRATLPGDRRTALDLAVRISNLEGAPVVVTGADQSITAARVDAVVPSRVTVNAQGWADVVLRASVDCRSARPLALPALQVQRPGLGVDLVAVEGDGTPLVHACQSRPRGPRVLELVSVVVDVDTRLRVAFRSPTGRTAIVQGVLAGGVRLSGRPEPARVEADARTVWLTRPATCPPEWLHAGLPRTVDLELDAGTSATLTVDLGPPLIRWLQAGPCRAGAPS
jgi:hypothetical protein